VRVVALIAHKDPDGEPKPDLIDADVDDGSTRFLVPPKDASVVATCLEQVLSDRDLAKRMGAAGRDHVRDRFTQERLVSDIRSLYEELLR
jgi:glycosyltransferase involved in cell wall biosynthesis